MEKRISKKIHYCWFGNNPKSEMEKKCIASWEKYCPDYQIIEWNEDNYDVNSSKYMQEVYSSKKWGYSADYARLDIVYKEGGIYLDTDVEIYRNFDDMLADEAFFNFACAYEVNAGSGFGAIAGNNILMELRDFYTDKHFINKDGTLNLQSCAFYQNPVLENYGFNLAENKYQVINNIVLYPSEVMNPGGRSNIIKNITDKTHSYHHAEGTHRNEREREMFKNARDRIKKRLNI